MYVISDEIILTVYLSIFALFISKIKRLLR